MLAIISSLIHLLSFLNFRHVLILVILYNLFLGLLHCDQRTLSTQFQLLYDPVHRQCWKRLRRKMYPAVLSVTLLILHFIVLLYYCNSQYSPGEMETILGISSRENLI